MIMQAITAGLGILGGLGKMESAKDLRKSKEKQLKMKADYNKKQIDKNYTENYSKLINQYAQNQSNILLQEKKAENAIRVNATANVGAVDISGSSFLTTAKGTLENEFTTSMNQLSDWKYQQSLDLAKTAINQKLQVDLGVIEGTSQLKQQEAVQKREGFMDVLKGAGTIAGDVFSNYQNSKASDTFASNINDMNSSIVGGSQFYSKWNQALKPSQSGSLSLKYFGQ